MKISILCVGKIKEKYWNDAIKEYMKRLTRYCKPEIIEVADEKTPDNAPESVETMIRDKEGEKLLKHIDPKAKVVALAIKGRKVDSPGFAKWIDDYAISGCSHIQFVIGGSLGLSDEVLKRADGQISFSDMTFPHQMMRVVLLEQVYRSYKILSGEPYHK
ncbi:MAG: 23S rRNA (pseudouridine(1915)-N(3))-methyltransferase RlmH [Butyrivibrio sp.]|uniref:23S rRNA (pseudouridine(1915)-N(3))-methyltransferase RlmH n=1 Tax=Butyrivibrio sp. TaxID=28121 RepID=UPI0025E00021|nr:23S rRNA (pseudouridine(1915)-N(3))-methyltransferase RlmH [Butyrivibrio sp.]MCR5770151.1 23S rRNA (pseudouridine(1915)-N(3))-methyltransferase RlmH [Butyrivibrio sp.]